ncbi:MAG: hypothetical protein QGG09_04690 [Pirellulaceae bacterium]|nr:hypothetical protein [Pirellulaceae bacterium]
MKLGLITDIHEHVELLRSALDQLKREQVDQIVDRDSEILTNGQHLAP